MPLYDYKCPKCHAKQTLVRPIAARDDPLMCDCGGVMRRVMSVFLFRFRSPGYVPYEPATAERDEQIDEQLCYG